MPGDGERHEQRAGFGVAAHRVAGVGRRGHRPVDRVGEGGPGGLRRLAGEPAQRHAVAAVRGDVDVQHRLAQVQRGGGVRAGQQVGLGEHEDAVVVLAQSELPGRADHAVGDVAVGLARGDREVAGQHRTGECDDDEVARPEVGGAADDPPRGGLVAVGGVVVVPHVDAAPVDRLAVLVLLRLGGQHAADHERARDVGAGLLDGLDLQPGPDVGLGQAPAVEVGGQRGVLAQPAQRRPHDAFSRVLLRTRRGFEGVVPQADVIAPPPPGSG